MNITEVRVVDDRGVEHTWRGRGETHVVRTHMGDALTPEKSTQVRFLDVRLKVEVSADD